MSENNYSGYSNNRGGARAGGNSSNYYNRRGGGIRGGATGGFHARGGPRPAVGRGGANSGYNANLRSYSTSSALVPVLQQNGSAGETEAAINKYMDWDHSISANTGIRTADIGDKEFSAKLNFGNSFSNCSHDTRSVTCICARSKAWYCIKCKCFYCTEDCSKLEQQQKQQQPPPPEQLAPPQNRSVNSVNHPGSRQRNERALHNNSAPLFPPSALGVVQQQPGQFGAPVPRNPISGSVHKPVNVSPEKPKFGPMPLPNSDSEDLDSWARPKSTASSSVSHNSEPRSGKSDTNKFSPQYEASNKGYSSAQEKRSTENRLGESVSSIADSLHATRIGSNRDSLEHVDGGESSGQENPSRRNVSPASSVTSYTSCFTTASLTAKVGAGRGRGRGRGVTAPLEVSEPEIGIQRPKKYPATNSVPLDVGAEVNVSISWVESLAEVFVQRCNDVDEVFKIEEEGEQMKCLPTLPNPQINDLCMVKFLDDSTSNGNEDVEMYRAKIIKVYPGSAMVRVQYIDYGNTAELPKSELKTMPEELLEKPAYANRIIFKQICPSEAALDFSEEAKLFYSKLVKVGDIGTFLPTEAGGDYYFGNVQINGKDICDQIIAAGFAEKFN